MFDHPASLISEIAFHPLFIAALAVFALAVASHGAVNTSRARRSLPALGFLGTLMAVMVNLRFAISLLLVIAGAAIAGTLVGGSYGEEAQAAFFASWPFSALMLVFLMALVLAVNSRRPWKRTHIGWIMTHAGLVIIVVGHMITQRSSVSGHVSLFKGQTSVDAEGDLWLFTADLPEVQGGVRVTIPAPVDEMAPDVPLESHWDLPVNAGAPPVRLTIERFLPNFALRHHVEPDPSAGPPLHPAVRIELKEPGDRRSDWLFADDARRSSRSLGSGLTALYRRVDDRAGLEDLLATPTAKVVVESKSGARMEVDVQAALREDQPLGASGYTLRVQRQFQRFRMSGGAATDAPDGELNEALLLTVKTPRGETEKRAIFARFPDDDTLGKKIDLPFKMLFEHVGRLPNSSVAAVDIAGAAPVCVVTDPKGAHDVRELKVGAPISLPWIGAEAVIADRLERTREREEPWTRTYQPLRPAMLVRLESPGAATTTAWILGHDPEGPATVASAAGPVRLSYDRERWPLGFSVRLDRFVLKRYEGTEEPLSFESFVSVFPHDGESPFGYHIFMNHVMDYRGWRFFQTSYDPNTLEWSSFTASHDPGRGIVYLGYILTPLGLLFIVWIKPWLVKRQALQLAAAGLAAKAARDAEGQAMGAGETGKPDADAVT